MATLTVYANEADGFLQSMSMTYADARSGTDILSEDTTAEYGVCGQSTMGPFFSVVELFTSYDTSSIPDDNTITNAQESLYLSTNGDLSVTDFIQELRSYNWGNSLTVAKWIPCMNLGNYTLLSSKSVSPSAEYNNFPSSTAFCNAINKTGHSYFIHSSSRSRLGNAPSGDECVLWVLANSAGTTQDPKLTIIYESGGTIPVSVNTKALTSTATANCKTPQVTSMSSLSVSVAPANMVSSSLLYSPNIAGTRNVKGSSSVISSTGSTISPTINATRNAVVQPIVTSTNIINKSPVINVNITVASSATNANVIVFNHSVLGVTNTSIPSEITQALATANSPAILGIQNSNITSPIGLSSANAIMPVVLGKTNISAVSPIATATALGIAPVITTTKNPVIQSVVATSTAGAYSPISDSQGNITVKSSVGFVSAEIKSPSITSTRNPSVISTITDISAQSYTSVVIGTKNASVISKIVTADAVSIAPILDAARNPIISTGSALINILSVAPSVIGIRNVVVNSQNSIATANSVVPMVSAKQNATIQVPPSQNIVESEIPIITSTRDAVIGTISTTAFSTSLSPVVDGQTVAYAVVNAPIIQVQSELNDLSVIGVRNANVENVKSVALTHSIVPTVTATRNAKIETNQIVLVAFAIDPIVKVILRYIGYKMILRDYSSSTSVSDNSHGTKIQTILNQSTVDITQTQTNIRVQKHGTNVIDYDI